MNQLLLFHYGLHGLSLHKASMTGTRGKSGKTQQTLGRILDAALECYTCNGIAGTTLDEVARTAGVGRTTLYRYVANRNDLLNQVVLRDAREQQEEMRLLTRSHTDFAQGMVDTIVYVMRGRRTRPINVLLFGGDNESLIDRINLSPANFYPLAERLLAPLFLKAQQEGKIRPGVTMAGAVQWSTRIMLSLVNYPEEFLNDEPALRDFLQTFLVPSLICDETSDVLATYNRAREARG